MALVKQTVEKICTLERNKIEEEIHMFDENNVFESSGMTCHEKGGFEEVAVPNFHVATSSPFEI